MAGKSTYEFIRGDILRRGDKVGRYDPDTNAIVELDVNLPKQIRTILANKLAGMSRADDLTKATWPGKPLIEVFAPQTANSEFASFQAPPPPAMDPKYGDKTPAYVEWMFRYRKSEAESLYRNRKVTLEDRPSSVGLDVSEEEMPKEREEEWH